MTTEWGFRFSVRDGESVAHLKRSLARALHQFTTQSGILDENAISVRIEPALFLGEYCNIYLQGFSDE